MLADAETDIETDIIANLAAKIELIPSLEHGLVAVPGNVAHHDLVTLADKCSGQSGASIAVPRICITGLAGRTISVVSC